MKSSRVYIAKQSVQVGKKNDTARERLSITRQTCFYIPFKTPSPGNWKFGSNFHQSQAHKNVFKRKILQGKNIFPSSDSNVVDPSNKKSVLMSRQKYKRNINQNSFDVTSKEQIENRIKFQRKSSCKSEQKAFRFSEIENFLMFRHSSHIQKHLQEKPCIIGSIKIEERPATSRRINTSNSPVFNRKNLYKVNIHQDKMEGQFQKINFNNQLFGPWDLETERQPAFS